jgi:hypothetical protein
MRYRLQCSACPEAATLGNTDIGADKASHIVPQTFARRGWTVGKSPERDLCPACTRGRRSHPVSTGAVPMANPTLTTPSLRAVPSGTVPVQVQDKAKAEPPRVMSRDERRIINAKIDEVYIDEAHGYSIGWNDDRVATDLGVPRAWVSQMRDENFGPELNAEVVKARTETDALVAEMAKLREDMKASAAQASTLMMMADKCQANLARLIAAAGRK